MLSREAEVRAFLDQIREQLIQPNVPLTAIVREASRLAYLCDDPQHRRLFELHLAGMESNGAPGPEGTTWPDPYRKLQWDVPAAFCHDRTSPKKVLLQPLEQIKRELQNIQQNVEKFTAARGPLSRRSPFWDVLLEHQEPLRRIRERVTSFLKQVEDSLSGHADSAQVLVDEVAPSANSLSTSPESPSTVPQPRPVVVPSINILDPELRTRCLDLLDKFTQDGHHDRLDTVITEATRILENRLRRLSGARPEMVGVDLAAHAFGGKTPPLKVSDITAEQEGAHLLYRGIFGFIRNQTHHRLTGVLQPQRVVQILGMIDYVLALAESAGQQQKPQP